MSVTVIFCFSCGQDVDGIKCGCEDIDILSWSIDAPDTVMDSRVYPGNLFFLNPKDNIVIHYENDRSIVACCE